MKVRTEARREAILEVARRVFLDVGFERASMSEIARQVGGSKATLYGYFASKEALFVAASHAEGRQQLETTVADLGQLAAQDLQAALLRLGEALVTFLSLPQTMAAMRMVLAEAGHSDVGRLFYEQGPGKGLAHTAETLHEAMSRGELRDADPLIAAQHLHALLSSELQPLWYQREQATPSATQCEAMARRAVTVFMRGYAVDVTTPK